MKFGMFKRMLMAMGHRLLSTLNLNSCTAENDLPC